MAWRSTETLRRGFASELAKLAVETEKPRMPGRPRRAKERTLETLARRGLNAYRTGFEQVAAKPVKIEKSLPEMKPPDLPKPPK